MNQQETPVNVTGYVRDMTREERYDWEHYESPPLERLETMTEVVRRGLDFDESEKPGVENDLIALELVSDEAQGIINRSWLAGITAGLLGLAGAALSFSNGGEEWINLLYPQLLCIGLPAIAIASGIVGENLSRAFIFKPMANRFVNKRISF